MRAAAQIRVATTDDAGAIARIGRAAVPAQYERLVDPDAIEAVLEQTCAATAVAGCTTRCASAGDTSFLVAEHDARIAAFLHFDSFGPEPELHRLYTDPGVRSRGLGELLMQALHERLAGMPYMLLVVDGNDRAVRFYERHGLHVERIVEGLTYYRERMGVAFPAGTRSLPMLLMRRGPAGRDLGAQDDGHDSDDRR